MLTFFSACMLTFFYNVFLSIFILKTRDIELNPGPKKFQILIFPVPTGMLMTYPQIIILKF